MTDWIIHPTTLEGHHVRLEPMDTAHFEALITLAGTKAIWEHYALDGSNPTRMQQALDKALQEREKGTQYPFVILDTTTDAVIGSSRYLDIQPQHRKLEIGWTWLAPAYWGTVINLECKLLLFTHCFETLLAVRVQLKTDANNIRSRKAIEKVGGKFEGILRHDMVRDNQSLRDSAYYSVLHTEWEEVKSDLLQKTHKLT